MNWLNLEYCIFLDLKTDLFWLNIDILENIDTPDAYKCKLK